MCLTFFNQEPWNFIYCFFFSIHKDVFYALWNYMYLRNSPYLTALNNVANWVFGPFIISIISIVFPYEARLKIIVIILLKRRLFKLPLLYYVIFFKLWFFSHEGFHFLKRNDLQNSHDLLYCFWGKYISVDFTFWNIVFLHVDQPNIKGTNSFVILAHIVCICLTGRI